MKNIYISQDSDGDLFFIGHRNQLDTWLKDGSLGEGDIIYVVKGQMKVKSSCRLVLTKEASQ